jgi:dihydrofolate reductase
VIEGDVAEAVARLKQEQGHNILVNGSGALVRSLLRAQLLDQLRLYVHPVVVGSGIKLFEEASAPVDLTLTDSQAYANGVMSLTYRPGGADTT